jgi:hypothetical protein
LREEIVAILRGGQDFGRFRMGDHRRGATGS